MNKKILLALSVALAMPSVAHADTLFESLPDLTVAPQSNAWCSSCYGSYKVFDTFTLASDSVIDTVSFTVQSDYGFPASIDLGFHTVSGGLPDTQIASYTIAPGDFLSMIATPYNTTVVTVGLPGLALSAGTYDISIYNASNLGVPGYYKQGGSLYQQGNGFHTDQVAAFRLEGGAGAVPEPASWAMMIGGLGIVGGAMRRRSAKVAFA